MISERPSLAAVVTEVDAIFGVDEAQMRGESRSQHIVDARHVAMMVARDVLQYTTPRIGQYFNRDHSTVFHAQAAIWRKMAGERSLAYDAVATMERLRARWFGSAAGERDAGRAREIVRRVCRTYDVVDGRGVSLVAEISTALRDARRGQT